MKNVTGVVCASELAIIHYNHDMNRVFGTILFFLLIPSYLFSQEKPVITVLDFKSSGVSEIEVEIFVDFITSHIVNTGKFRVIDRTQRASMLEEIEFAFSDCAEEACELEIGRQLAADKIVIGSVGKVETRYILNIKLVDVETSETVASESKMYKSMSDLLDDSMNLVRIFTGDQEQKKESPPIAEIAIEEKTEESIIKSATATEGKEELPRELQESQERQGSAIEVNVGGMTSWGQLYPLIGGSYIYQFNNSFSLGLCVWIAIAPSTFPLGYLKFVFGNKVDDWAFMFGLGIPVAVGIYYKNFFLSVGSFVFMDVMPSIEIGYSLYFGQ